MGDRRAARWSKGMVIILNKKLKKLLALVMLFVLCGSCAAAVQAGEVTVTPTTTAPPVVVVQDSDTQSLGSITFRASNSTRVPVGKSTTLYVKIEDMVGTVVTSFSCSNPGVASIEKINNMSVRVTGVKEGEVVITATAGGKSAKYTLIVGDEQVTAPPTQPTAQTPETDATQSVDINLSSEYQNEILALVEKKKESSAGSIILGVIGLVAIIGGLGSVISVMFSNHTPKLTLYPGSRRRFNAGTGKGRTKKRLLPDHYYRNVKKH